MDEIVVQVSRTVACRTRLKLLATLAADKELAPSRLAIRLQVSEPQVCAHLRRLSAAGLICRRHSGAWSFAVAQSPYGESAFSGQVARWLFKHLKSPPKLDSTGLGEKDKDKAHSPLDRVERVIFNVATGFTNLRRLQILRHLQRNGNADLEILSMTLKMSPAAASRHVSKLERRGMVLAARQDSRLALRLTTDWKSPLHRDYWEMVSALWQKEKLQS